MSWIAMGGGRSGFRPGKGGGGGGSYSDEDIGGGGGSGGGMVHSFKGVPLCGAAMCSGKGMPPPRLPQPGINCVNMDRPCLPCDIVNVRLRAAVTGVRVKRAVAECQKRYFCNVWNVLFAWLFPDHRPGPCPNLTAGDADVKCRSRSGSGKRKRPPAGQTRRLPYGADPGRGQPQPPPPPPPPPVQAKRALFDDLPAKRPEAPPPMASDSAPKAPPKRRREVGLRYNIWDMPMPDSSKGNKND